MGKKSVFYWFLRSLSRYSSNLRGREGQNNSPIFPNSAQKFPIQLSNHAEQADCNPSQCLRSPAPVSMRPAPRALLHAPCPMPVLCSPHLSLTLSHFRPKEYFLFSVHPIADGVWGGSPFPGWRGPYCHLSIEKAFVTGPLTPGY